MRKKRAFVLVTVLLVGVIIATLLLTQHANVLTHFRVTSRTSDYLRMGLLEQSAADSLAYLFDQNLYAMDQAGANGNGKASANRFKTKADLEAIAVYRLPDQPGQVVLSDPVIYTELSGNQRNELYRDPENYRNTTVYNMDSDEWAHSFLGRKTVPPASALLVLNTTLGGFTRRGVVLVGRPFLSINEAPGVFAATSFQTGGETSVATVEEDENNALIRSGGRLLVKGYRDVTTLLGNTSYGSWYERLKRITGRGSFNLNDGVVSVKDSHSASDVRSKVANTGIVSEYNPEKDDIEGFDLQDEINDARKGKGGYLVSELALLNSDPNESRLKAGKFFFSGNGSDVHVPGDLILEEGASIVVDGNLVVRGAVRGKGSIIASGDITFKGNVDFASAPDQSVAVASRKNIEVQGYHLDLQGTNFSEGATAIKESTNRIRRNLNSIVTILNEHVKPNGDIDMTTELRNELHHELGKSFGIMSTLHFNIYKDGGFEVNDDGHVLPIPDQGNSSQDDQFAHYVQEVEGQFATPAQDSGGDIYIGKLKVLRDLLNDDNGFNNDGSEDFKNDHPDVSRGNWGDIEGEILDELTEFSDAVAKSQENSDPSIIENEWESLSPSAKTAAWLQDPEVCPTTPAFFRDLVDDTANGVSNGSIFSDAGDTSAYGGFKNPLLQRAFYRMVEMYNELEFSDPTSTRFQGIIYSEGNIEIGKRISVKGSIVANPLQADGSKGNVIFKAGGRVASLKSQTNPLVQVQGSRSEVLLKIE